jgi:hypothetical protein
MTTIREDARTYNRAVAAWLPADVHTRAMQGDGVAVELLQLASRYRRTHSAEDWRAFRTALKGYNHD